MASLKHTLVVRDQEGNPVALLAGQPVPDWAKDLVHADDLNPEPKRTPTARRSAHGKSDN